MKTMAPVMNCRKKFRRRHKKAIANVEQFYGVACDSPVTVTNFLKGPLSSEEYNNEISKSNYDLWRENI